VVVVASHLLALSLMFELRGPPPPPQPPMPPQQVQGETLSNPITVTNEKSYVVRRGLPLQLQPEGRPLPPQKEPQRSLWAFVLDVGFRLSALLIATWFGARWLATPMLRLAAAARELGAISTAPAAQSGHRGMPRGQPSCSTDAGPHPPAAARP
jgi:protein-histidine pros-kinase